ncbi:MAG: transcription termination/antitermination protein NusA [Elusimicrobia bacterium]|nr:transcription termination/antitermination protein NusA [Elusimicrobiota bacterium]
MDKEKNIKGKSELILALEQLEREKNIKKDETLKTITDGLVSALRKYFGKLAQITAVIDPDTGEMKGFMVKNVVDEVFTPELEISLTDALKMDPSVKAGDVVNIPVDIKDFSRIAAQTAKQVLIHRIKEIEKLKLFEEFKPREGELVTGIVHHITGRDIFVDLGKIEAVLPYSEQIRREHYAVNQRIRAIIHAVEKGSRGLQVILSRTSGNFMKALFEAEVPEISEKIIEIVSIVREPGIRAKALVKSSSPQVDPVGACVGIRGSRIRVIMNELHGEKIDLIPWSDEPEVLLAKAFSPAKVDSIKILDKENKKALAILPDDQLAIAIGRDGQNINLVARITGWTVDVKSEAQKVEEKKKNMDTAIQDLLKIEGIGPKLAETLVNMGITDVKKLSTLTEEDLSSFQGIGLKTAQKIVAGVKKYLKDKSQVSEN